VTLNLEGLVLFVCQYCCPCDVGSLPLCLRNVVQRPLRIGGPTVYYNDDNLQQNVSSNTTLSIHTFCSIVRLIV